jgi:hypothetical protein
LKRFHSTLSNRRRPPADECPAGKDCHPSNPPEFATQPFAYQSRITDRNTGPFGGYGFEVAFVHYPDNHPNTPRIFDNEFELWVSYSVVCEGLSNCDPNAPPAYRAQSAFTLSRRRARLSGGIYGP